MSTVALGSIAAAGIGAVGSVISGSTQANAAKSAQQLQAEEAQKSLDFQMQEWNTQQQNEAPWLKAGTGAIGMLSEQLTAANSGTGPLAPWTGTFNAPTAAEAEATPGYQFEKQQGLEALQNLAAASGNLESGGTLKATTNYAEGLASTNYEQAFQNALTQYQTAYNTFQNNQTNTFNREVSVAGLGQQTAAQLGTQGQQAATSVGNINLTTGAQQGQDIQNAAAANASGYVGAANAFSGGLNNISSLAMLQQILNQQNAGTYNPGTMAPWFG